MKKLIGLFLILILSATVFAVTDWNRCVRDNVATETKMILKTGEDSGTSTSISSDVVTVNASFMIVDTESDAATDVIVTLNAGAADGRYDQVRNGDIVLFKSELASQDVKLVSSGNIVLGQYGDLNLGGVDDFVQLQYDETNSNWLVIATNLAAGLPVGTVDINGGAIDGTTIGATTPSTAIFTTCTATTTDVNILGGALDANNENITNIDVDSGAIDGVIIGGASAAAGTFTTSSATTANVTVLMNLTPQATTPNAAATGNVFCQESDGIIYGYDGSSWNAFW
jgi:hypothetical protein